MPKPKTNYKVFDTNSKKYFSSGYRSKSTWQSLTWAMSAAEDLAKRIGPANVEIHVFPIEAAIRVPYKEMREKIKEETQKKEMKKSKKLVESKKKALLQEFDLHRSRLLEVKKKLEDEGIIFKD